jgi:hypothetical protein
VNLFSDYNLSLNLKHMKMKSKLEKGALLLAIALSGEVAAQTKTHHKIRVTASNVRGF